VAKEPSQKEVELLPHGRRFSAWSSSSPSFSKLGELGFCLEEGKGFKSGYSTSRNLHKTLHFKKENTLDSKESNYNFF